MMKTTTMDAVKNYADLDGEGTMLNPSMYRAVAEENLTRVDDEEVVLPKIQIVVATKSAEAGINGKWLEFGKITGMPADFYELIQMLGRVGRVSGGAPGSSTFEVHIDFNSVVSVVIRIMQCDDASERKIQLSQLMKVVKFLLLPSECYHAGMEETI